MECVPFLREMRINALDQELISTCKTSLEDEVTLGSKREMLSIKYKELRNLALAHFVHLVLGLPPHDLLILLDLFLFIAACA